MGIKVNGNCSTKYVYVTTAESSLKLFINPSDLEDLYKDEYINKIDD